MKRKLKTGFPFLKTSELESFVDQKGTHTSVGTHTFV